MIPLFLEKATTTLLRVNDRLFMAGTVIGALVVVLGEAYIARVLLNFPLPIYVEIILPILILLALWFVNIWCEKRELRFANIPGNPQTDWGTCAQASTFVGFSLAAVLICGALFASHVIQFFWYVFSQLT